MSDIKLALSKQLGFTPTEKLVHAMTQACAYEFMHDHIVNRWCSLLDPAAVEALTSNRAKPLYEYTQTNSMSPLAYFDYQQDVRAYYRGRQEDSRSSSYLMCTLFSGMLQEMSSHVEGRPSSFWRLRFTSLEIYLLVLDFLVSNRITFLYLYIVTIILAYMLCA
jgi:hypothetical protein